VRGDADAGAVAVVVLAAGGSRRLGTPKQLLPFRGRTLLRHAVEVAVEAASAPTAGESVDDPAVVVVLGAEAERLRAELRGLPVVVVVNAEWATGVGSSVRTGLQAAGEVPGCLFVAADQPFVTADLLRGMLALFHGGAPIVACAYAGTLGVPALFGRAYFGELAGLEGDAGAKRIIERHGDVVRAVRFERGATDVDTQDDWESLL
jgi:molybdenum cofactor cytidylyltransferase